MINLNKRRNFPNPLTTQQVDKNWDDIEQEFQNVADEIEEISIQTTPTPVENEYDFIADLLDSQPEQTAGSLQYVDDATADPTVNYGYAYYEKLSTSTASLSDYRKLSNQEVIAIRVGKQKVRDQNGNEFEAKLAVIYGQGFTATQNPDGSYNLEYTPGAASPPKQKIKTGNYTLTPDDNDATISMDGGVCTINPNTQTYPDAYIVAQKNITDSTDGSIVCTAKSGWNYKVNDAAEVSDGTFSFPAGATCTIVKFEGTNKIYIDGGVE